MLRRIRKFPWTELGFLLVVMAMSGLAGFNYGKVDGVKLGQEVGFQLGYAKGVTDSQPPKHWAPAGGVRQLDLGDTYTIHAIPSLSGKATVTIDLAWEGTQGDRVSIRGFGLLKDGDELVIVGSGETRFSIGYIQVLPSTTLPYKSVLIWLYGKMVPIPNE